MEFSHSKVHLSRHFFSFLGFSLTLEKSCSDISHILYRLGQSKSSIRMDSLMQAGGRWDRLHAPPPLRQTGRVSARSLPPARLRLPPDWHGLGCPIPVAAAPMSFATLRNDRRSAAPLGARARFACAARGTSSAARVNTETSPSVSTASCAPRRKSSRDTDLSWRLATAGGAPPDVAVWHLHASQGAAWRGVLEILYCGRPPMARLSRPTPSGPAGAGTTPMRPSSTAPILQSGTPVHPAA